MNESIKSILSDEIISEIETAEQQNKDNPEAIYSLYIHIVPKEISGYDWDKYYVGITKRNVKLRWRNGLGYDYTYLGHRSYIWRAIEKYDWNNIKHVTISSSLLEYEAKSLEKKLISYLKSNIYIYGYNISSGGEGGTSPTTKNIAQYSLDGDLIEVYPNATVAQEKTNIDRSTICHVARGDYKTAGNYMWRFVNDNIPQKIDAYDGIHKQIVPLLQYDLNGNFIKEWESMRDASDYYGIKIRPYNQTSCNFQWRYKYGDGRPIEKILIRPNKTNVYMYDVDGAYINKYSSISDACRQNLFIKSTSVLRDALYREIDDNYAFGHRFCVEYYDKLPPLRSNYFVNRIYKNPVVQFSKENMYINVFPSISEACRILKIENRNGIKSCCKGQLKTSCGYKWKYLNDIDELEITDSFLLDKYHELFGKDRSELYEFE